LVKKKAVVKKSASTKKSANTKKSVKSTKTSKKRKPKKQTDDESLDSGIVIVDDEFSVDKNIINEERRAYLEEARSQDASE
tara:strand:- start:9131 stop:9373 length:243 start_codon:yes stop_codon:yes gene_type:complete